MLTPMAEEEKKTSVKKTDGAKIGAVIILIISAIVFIPVGGSAVISSILQKNRTPVFGKFKGQKIEYKAGSDFAANVSYIAQRYQSYGYDTSQMYSYIFEQAFQSTVQNMYAENAVKKSGYSVPEAAVNRAILPYFYDENGVYSSKIFNQADESQKSEIRTAAEKSLVYSRFTDDVLGSDYGSSSKLYGLKYCSKEENFVSAMGSEKHSFVLAAFPTDTLPREETVKFANEHSEFFRKYNLSAISLTEKLDADNTLKSINDGETTFDAAVTDVSEKLYTDSDGKLTSSYYYQLKNITVDEENLNKVIGLKTGEISEVIQTSRGYTIFRCDGDSSAIDMSQDESVDTVLNYIKGYEISYIENYYTGIAGNFKTDAVTLPSAYFDMSEGENGVELDPNVRADAKKIDEGGESIVLLDSFAMACRKYDVTKVEVPAFPVNFGNSQFYATVPSDVSELSSLSSNASAFETLFSLKKDEISAPFVLGSNVLVVKCVGIQKDDPDEKDNYAVNAESYDSDDLRKEIMASPDLENNFIETFYGKFMKN